jgi:NAD(P)-dependent dehydrogenase (short-subunit alcohol dehydrogenase family)
MPKTTKPPAPRHHPARQQRRTPGPEADMHPRPEAKRVGYRAAGKLAGKVALITGGDVGIGRSVAAHFAAEGADVAISFLEEERDAEETRRLVEAEGRRCLLLPGDIGDEEHCRDLVDRTVTELGSLHVLVNNAAEVHLRKEVGEISAEQLESSFRTNVFSFFFLTKAALPVLRRHRGSIINTTSATSLRSGPEHIDQAATRGAIVAFTRSLAQSLVRDGVRVNAVAPGPHWSQPLMTSSTPEIAERSGHDMPLAHMGEAGDVGPCYVFLASDDASCMTGQVVQPHGGDFSGS